jgi:hypothetical protein
LGSVLKLGGGFGGVTTAAARCSCKGSGLDQEAVWRGQIESFVERMARLERRNLALAQKLRTVDARALAAAQRLLDKQARIKNSSQSWQELIHYIISDGAAVANTTTEAIIVPNVTIPGNYMARDRALRLRVWGKVSTTGTPTLIWAIRYNGVGGTILAQSEALTMGSGVTNVIWVMEADIQTRSSGSSGSLFVSATVQVNTATTTTLPHNFGVSGFDAPAAVGSLDLTADWPLSVTVDWSAANAANTTTAHQYYLESLN